MRSFLLPEEGCHWVSRDFSSQEVRLLAHFEQGALLDAFIKNPALDPHQLVVDTLRDKFDIKITRKQAKAIAFGIIYGMGVPGMAKKMKLDPCEASELIEGYHFAFPGVSEVQRGTKARGQYDRRKSTVRKLNRRIQDAHDRGLSDQYIRSMTMSLDRAINQLPPCNYVETIGGRQYHVEAPKIVGTNMRTFEYKLMNYLIQGSAADQTKRALLHWFKKHPAEDTFLCTVHDEINISSPRVQEYALKDAMEIACNEGIDCPMTTTYDEGDNWGDIS
jgi:DNA polymerase I-like protein with 3'-5' exonuclease and polymerase domains